MPESDTGPRLLLVGIDAGCLPVIGSLTAAGITPTLGGLLRRGVSAPLESQLPPWTASAWPSIYTGKNPGKHGVFDFLSFDGYDWTVVNGSRVRERPIWELLSDAGFRSVVVNAPVTHPPRAFDGALVPGLTAPESPRCHPPGLLEEVEDACGPYRVYPDYDGGVPSVESYERVVESRGAAVRHLCERFEPDFAFLQFQVTDSVFHERPGDRRATEAVYGAVDDVIEDLLATVDPQTIMLVSDHGIGPVSGPEFRVNEHLRSTGHVETTRAGDGMPNWTRTWEADLLEGATGDGHSTGLLELAMQAASTVGVTTERVASALDAVGLREAVGRRVPNGAVRAGSERVAFAESRAYVRSKSELGVRINLAGREPDGRVSPSEYDSVRHELIEDLAAVRAPDGRPIFESVLPREAVFSGPAIDDAPDIVTVPRGFDTAISARLGGERFAPPMEPWNHKRTGLIALEGAAVDPAVVPADATIFDVAPTICSLFDLPVDETMDGRPLSTVGTAETDTYPAYDPAPPVAGVDGAVEDRLSDLGYL